jgi:hypothetical protein
MRTRISKAASWMVGIGLAAGPALGQDALRPPRIDEAPTGPKIWMYAVFILLLALTVFAASLKSKRGHQD